ncbi:MAG TPA: glycosyltransferase, partial [Chloroflexi bacterium]|nr:glycosyltransferase [Chloroflexota bacterium]
AMAYFLRDIYPLVRALRPQVRLRITGKTDGVPVERLPLDEDVTLTGYVDDIRPVVARSWITVVPLRVGGGTRLKILESLALGTPVVSTSKGAEGLALEDGKHLLIADTPQAFSQAVVRLLEDPHLRARLGEAGRERVRQLYDWKQIGEVLRAYLRHIRENHALVSV